MVTINQCSFIVMVAATLVVGCDSLAENSRKEACKNNLRLIAHAIEGYREIEESPVPAAIYDSEGRALHSWRVLITPYLESNLFYDRYELSEPWDSTTNQQFHHDLAGEKGGIEVNVTGISDRFRCPGRTETSRSFNTNYVMIVDPREPLRAFTGISRRAGWQARFPATRDVMVVEVKNSGIHWMEPRDISIEELAYSVNGSKDSSISSWHPSGAFILKFTGEVEFLSKESTEDFLRALLVERPNVLDE